MDSFIHLIYIPLRGVGIDLRNDDWFRERIEIFKNYTLKSLKNQTNQNFVLWISMRPQDKHNPLVKQLSEYLKDEDFLYVMTFEGLMYHDDKFSDSLWRKTQNIGRILRRAWRNRNFKEVLPSLNEIRHNKNHTLKARLSRALNVMQKYLGEADWVYMTRIDSDDMFDKAVVQMIQLTKPQANKALTCTVGFVYDTITKQLGEWKPPTNPPFHTIIFPSKTFFDAELHKAYYGTFNSHEDIPDVFITEHLFDHAYCVTTHSPVNHISTTFKHPFNRVINVTEQQKKSLLARFGI